MIDEERQKVLCNFKLQKSREKNYILEVPYLNSEAF